jgi:hypothetical protein
MSEIPRRTLPLGLSIYVFKKNEGEESKIDPFWGLVPVGRERA